MNTQHTPGPWKHENRKFVLGSDGLLVATTSGGDDLEVEANARLIASAPDMLEVLQELQQFINSAVVSGIDLPPLSTRCMDLQTKIYKVIDKL